VRTPRCRSSPPAARARRTSRRGALQGPCAAWSGYQDGSITRCELVQFPVINIICSVLQYFFYRNTIQRYAASQEPCKTQIRALSQSVRGRMHIPLGMDMNVIDDRATVFTDTVGTMHLNAPAKARRTSARRTCKGAPGMRTAGVLANTESKAKPCSDNGVRNSLT